MPIDPVCHNTVEPRRAAAFCDYKGIVYYFCSSGCHKTFTANIRQYTGAVNATTALTRDNRARDGEISILDSREISPGFDNLLTTKRRS